MTLDDLYASPDHYLHSFEGDAAVFVPMDRAAYHRSIFLDARISAAAPGAMRIPIATLTNAPVVRPTGWIFHVAHCGSTLLARALDRLEYNLVLREPLALRQLALSDDAGAGALRFTAAMSSRRYSADAPTVIKANVPVNFLLPALTALDPAAHAIFLYLPLADYLLAILRSDQHRIWLRNVTTRLAPHLGTLEGRPDAERAAVLWLAQIRRFAAAMEAMPGARSLNAETFFARPAPVLQAAAAHLQIGLTAQEIDEIVAGPLFATYSKNPAVRFDNDDRLMRRRQAEHALADDLAQAERWIDGQDSVFAALATLDEAALLR